MFERGLYRLHLRKENASIDVYRNYLRQIPAAFHPRISIHDYPELLKEFAAIGYHCKAAIWNDEKKIDEVLSLRPATLSASFHSWEELLQCSYPFKYVFISPVFDSISKMNYLSTIDTTKLGAIKQRLSANKKISPDVFALGGVATDNIQQLYNCGFDGVAVLGSVWHAPDCLGAFKTIADQIKKISELDGS